MNILKTLFHTENSGQKAANMKIAVVCANGRAGRLTVKEVLSRGLDVPAVVKRPSPKSCKRTCPI